MKINVWNTYKDRYEISKLENARILESWFHTNNKTLIDGGAVYTGSITAEKLNIGMNPNLMADGLDSFEQYPDGQIMNWTIGSMSTAWITSEKGYDGKKSLKIVSKSDTDSQNTFVYIGQTTNNRHTAEPNKNYIFSFYLMSTVEVDIPLYVAIPMRIGAGQVAGWEVGKNFTIKANSGWTRYSVLLPKKNVPTDYASMYLRMVKAFPANQAVYVDAIQWEEVPDSVTEPSPFKPAGTTVIHGGNITAGSITFNSNNYGGVAIDGNGMLISHAKSTISMNGNKGIEITRKSDNKRVLYVDGVGDVVIDGKVTIGSSTVFENGYDPTKLNSGMRNIARNTNFENDFKYWTQSSGNRWRIIDPTPDRPTSKYVATSATGLTAPGYISLYTNRATTSKGESIAFSTEFFVDNYDAWDKKSPFIVEFYDAAGTRVEWKDVYLSDMGLDSIPANKWVRLSYVMASAKDTVTHVGMRLCLMQNGSVYYREPKMERGTVATDWMPAPEDVKENLQSVVDTTTTISNDLGQVKIEVKDNKTKVVSSINASTEGIKIKGNLVDIQGQVTFNSLDKGMQDKVNAGTTANDNFNNMQIGSGNILNKSWLTPNAHVSSSYDANTDTWSVTGKSGASPWGIGLRITDKKLFIPSGSYVTLSFDVWTPNDANWNCDVNNRFVNKDTTTNDNDDVSKRKTSPKALKANTWTRVWSTWKAKDGEDDMYDYSVFGVVNDTGVDQLYKFRRIKVELGNQPTPWSDSLAEIREDININLTSLQDIAFSQGKRFYSHSYDGEFVPEAIVGSIAKNGVIGTSTWVITGNAWLYGRNPIPVDVNRTYKLRFRVRVTTNDASGTNNMYAGVVTLDKNFKNLTGGAGTHRYFAASNVPLKTTDGWRTFEGTITGTGDSANQFRTNTAYVRPMFIVNNSGTTGVSEVDLLEFIDVTEADKAQKTADSVTTNFNNSKDIWNNITNIVNGWKGAAIGGTTTINGGLIETSTITANKLFLGDTTNLCENPDFENDANGAFPTGFTQTANVRVKDISGFAGGNGSNRAMELDAINGYNNDVYSNSLIPVTPGQQFYVEAEARYLNSAGSGAGRLGFSCYNAKKQHMNVWSSAVYWTIDKNIAQPVFTKKGAIWTVPANCYYVYIWISFQNNGETTNKWYIDNIRINRAASGEMIVDGSIAAKHIQADTITAREIAASTITATQIAANTITVDKLNVNNIFGNSAVIQKIQAVDISANRIVSGNLEVGGSQLFVGTAWAISGIPSKNASAGLSMSVYTPSGEDYLITSQNTANEKFAYLKRVPLVGGKKVTVSYDYNFDANVKGVDVFILGSKAETTEANMWTTGFDYSYVTADTVYDERKDLGNGWWRVRKTFTLANDIKSGILRLDHNGVKDTATGNSRFRSIMVNYGNMAMDWQPHSDEDISIGGINARHIAADSITAREIKAGGLTIENFDDAARAKLLSTTLAVKANYNGFNSPNPGELFIHGFDKYGNPADVNGTIIYDGKKYDVPKGAMDTNGKWSKGFIMYDPLGRFDRTTNPRPAGSEIKPYSWTGTNWQCAVVVYDGGQWNHDNNSTLVKFTPLDTDIIIGEVAGDLVVGDNVKDAYIYKDPMSFDMVAAYARTQDSVDKWRFTGKTTINGGMIEADSVTAAQIKAGSITTNELSVLAKDFVNNFSITKNFNNYNIAGNTGVFSIVNDPLNVKGSVLKMTTGADIQIQSDFFEVNPSKTYRFKVSAYVPNPSATTSVYFGFYAFNESKVELPAASYVYELKQFEAARSNPYFWVQSGAGALTFKDGWIDMEAIVASCNAQAATDIPASKFVERAFVFPPGTKYAKMRFFHHYSKTVVDSYWAHPSVTEIDGGLFTFDQAQGGTLKLGTDTGNGFLQVVKQGAQGQRETVGQIDETGAYFPKIQADQIIGSVVGIEKASGQIFFDTVSGNDNNAGTRTSPKRNIQVYIDQMSKYITNRIELIQLNGNIDSPIFLRGFMGPGSIYVRSDNSAARKTINSGIVVDGVTCQLYIQHFIMQAQDRTMAETGTDSLINVTGSPNVDVWFCKLYGNGKVEMGITGVRWAFIRATDIEIYNVKSRAFSIIYNGTAYIKNCKGGKNPISILVSDYAVVQGEGTRPDGIVTRWANAYVGGYVGDGSSWKNDVWTIDYGEATPPPPPPPSEYVREWNSLGGQNWSANGYWDDEIYVKQGNWGYGDRTGVWWFSSDLKNTLSGKTILEAQLTITRYSKGGNSGAREARIVAHQYADNRPPNNPLVSGEYVSDWFSWGETKTINVTSFVQQKIASGVDKGFGLKFANSSANYMAFLPQAKLWVKYK